MSTQSTKIQWTDSTWNPVRGCARVSPGCENCYAEKVAHRFSGKGQPYEGLTVLGKKGVRWAGQARFVPSALGEPLTWRKPRKVFVNSMSDLFHDDVSNEQIAAIFGVMAACPQHTFQVLTKRPGRMLAWFRWLEAEAQRGVPTEPESLWWNVLKCANAAHDYVDISTADIAGVCWPLPNVWIGVSVENQEAARRCWWLLDLPAAKRFVSVEPLLGPVDLTAIDYYKPRESDFEPILKLNALTGHVSGPDEYHDMFVDWVIVGSESGPGARGMDVAWARSVVDQCRAANVPVFTKQIANEHDRKGGNPAYWPDGEWPREYPEDAQTP